MNYPNISIAIATFNSGRTLIETLNSIKNQSYPKNKIEVLIIDGGSKDKTLEIARLFNCRIIDNPKTELVYAKHIAYLKASGKYLMYLDSDEVLENPNSLKKKCAAVKKDKRIKAVMPSGYKSPVDGTSINNYINEFGDPFTFFIYRESKSDKFLIGDWILRYKVVHKDNDFVVFNFSDVKNLPLVELWAGGCIIDLDITRKSFPEIKNNPGLLAHLFYLLNSQGYLLAVTKDDPTIHHSTDGINKYLRKISSRIKNNVFQNQMGRGGFMGREQFQPFWLNFKKYLFAPYSFSLIFPLLDSLYLIMTRKKIIYLIHLPLCFYSISLIIYYNILKILNLKPKIKSYGT